MKKTLIASALFMAFASTTQASGISFADGASHENTTNYTEESKITGDVFFGEHTGLYVKAGSELTFSGQNVILDIDDNSGDATAVRVRNDVENKGQGATKVSFGTKEQKLDTLAVKVKSNGSAQGLWSSKYGSSTALTDLEESVIEVNAKTFNLSVESGSDDLQFGAFGLWAASKTAKTDTNPGTETANRAKIIVNADQSIIDVRMTEGALGTAVALCAQSQGYIEVNGNLYASAINGDGSLGHVISTRGDSKIKLGGEGKTVQLIGDIAFDYDGPTSGTDVDSTIDINLSGKDSFWKGSTLVSWYTEDPNKLPNKDKLEVSDFTLALNDGATWEPTVAKKDDPTADLAGMSYTSLNVLKLDGGNINITGDDIEVTVDNMSGSGTVSLATDGTSAGKFNVTKVDGSASLDVNLMDVKMEKELSSDEINAEQAKNLLSNVGGQGVETKTEVKEGLVNPGFGVNSKGETATNSANTLMQSSLELASAAPLALNRIMMNDVRKRLGDIRTSNGTHGAWARYDGGKLSGEGGLENDFHTIQVGIDTVPTADAPRMGVAFSYTDSDAEYARGSADMKAYSLAMYSTWMGDNGQFFDLIGRMGTADTDMVVDGEHKGSMDNVALSMSGEFGWRFDVTDSIYVEPQVEATYTYVNDDSLTLSTANYDVDAVHSLLGRIGFAAGMKCPSEYGNVYVRASAVHEFLGDSKITGVNAGNTNVYEIDGKDTWFEYGIGANFNITKSTYMWADVERTTGGALDEDWRATVGVRYAW